MEILHIALCMLLILGAVGLGLAVVVLSIGLCMWVSDKLRERNRKRLYETGKSSWWSRHKGKVEKAGGIFLWGMFSLYLCLMWVLAARELCQWLGI